MFVLAIAPRFFVPIFPLKLTIVCVLLRAMLRELYVREEANDIAYSAGRAIIYAPVGVVKPKRETITAQPSELLKQVAERMRQAELPSGQAVSSPEPT